MMCLKCVSNTLTKKNLYGRIKQVFARLRFIYTFRIILAIKIKFIEFQFKNVYYFSKIKIKFINQNV